MGCRESYVDGSKYKRHISTLNNTPLERRGLRLGHSLVLPTPSARSKSPTEMILHPVECFSCAEMLILGRMLSFCGAILTSSRPFCTTSVYLSKPVAEDGFWLLGRFSQGLVPSFPARGEFKGGHGGNCPSPKKTS